MKLYYAPGACSLSPHIALREAGLDFQLEKVDLRGKKTESGEDYTKVNPNGYVPALKLDDGTVLTEGPAIVQYVADRAPGAKLAPPNGSIDRYKLQGMLNFISTEIHKQFSPLFDPTAPQELRDKQVKQIGRRFDAVEKILAEKPYLLGEGFSVADGYLFVMTAWADHLKIDLVRWPKLKAYRDRIAARPAVQTALKAEGLAK